MRQLIKRHLDGRKVLFLFALTLLALAAMFGLTMPQVKAHSQGMELLDLMPAGYSHAYVLQLFNTLGDAGRQAYLYRQIPMDMVFPGLFGLSGCLVMAYFLNRLGKLNSRLFYLCLLPVLAGLLDYGENIGIAWMLLNHPAVSPVSAQLTALCSVLKSATMALTAIALLLVLNAHRKARSILAAH